MYKSCGSNSVPTKILHLVQDPIPKHLASIVTYLSLQEYFSLFRRQPK